MLVRSAARKGGTHPTDSLDAALAMRLAVVVVCGTHNIALVNVAVLAVVVVLPGGQCLRLWLW